MKYFFKCVSCTQKGIKKGYIKGATAQGGGRNLNFCCPSHHLSKKINALHLLHLLKLLKKLMHATMLKQKKLGKLAGTRFANGVGGTHCTRFASQAGGTHVMHGMHSCMEGRRECMVVSPSGLAAPCMSVFRPLV